MLTLSVQKRDVKGATVSSLRNSGYVPGVVYGAHQVSTPITLNAKEFTKVLHEAGEATLVSLSGLGEVIPTLIHSVDFDSLTNLPLHVDFYAVTKGEKVEVAIPLEFVGESPAVEAGGNLIKVLHELEVKANPMNLPHSISVDLSLLKELNDQIHVKDLVLPTDVESMIDEQEVIALVQPVVEEKVEEAPADISSIEVEKKGKEEEVAEGGSSEA